MKPTLIIVDDLKSVRDKLRKVLENDFEIIGEAKNGAEAIEVVSRGVPQLVLMDLVMPGMSGIESMRKILETVRPSPRVVMMSGLKSDSVVMQAFEAGACDFLLKPLDPQVLREVLSAFAREAA
jgi:two-component system chemotaxis response regulator CheY